MSKFVGDDADADALIAWLKKQNSEVSPEEHGLEDEDIDALQDHWNAMKDVKPIINKRR